MVLASAGAACLMFGAGCGGDSSESKPATGSDADGEDLSGQQATFVTFGGAEDKDFRAAFAEPVVEQTGLDLSFTSPTSYPKIRAQVETGNVDWTVIMADPWWSIQYCGDLLEELPSAVDVSAIDPKYQVDDCGVAGDTFTFNVTYNSDEFSADDPTSWEDFFDTDAFPGKRGVWGSYVVNGVLEGALLADGVAPEDLYPLDLDRAFAKLDTIRDDLTFYDSLAQSEQLMAANEVSMIVTGTETVGYHVATEGSPEWKPIWDQAIESWDYWIVPKGANLDAATALLNQIASPEAQSALAERTPSGWTVEEITPEPTLTPELTEWNPSVPDHRELTIPLDQQWWAENYDEVNAEWLDWVAG
jgi:putative spermidine/putrescine transport system substrate-binding protein